VIGTRKASWVGRLARAGFIAKAILYGTIGALAASAALGFGDTGSGGATDTRGAMATVLDAPLGHVLLAAIGIALLGYATWRIVEGIADPEDRGADLKGLALRGSFIVRGIAHGALALTAIRFAAGQSSGGDDDRPREATQMAFALPGGEWLVWVTALAVAGYGFYQLYRAAAATLTKRLDTAHLSAETGRWVIAVSRFGIAARGVVFIAIGWLLVQAATHHDPAEAGGLAKALRALRDLGRWPFAAIAVGLVAYGGYQVVNARYRRME
jgi:hypothetical protein